jgi:NAD(P)-dependent dehydrogenase (short-subunit alcohol dehydrogenase family)
MIVEVPDLVVVTGGASGIGAACARFFARHGAHVVIIDRDSEGADKIASEIHGNAFCVDVTRAQELDECATHIAARIGAVGVLINSAGVIQGPIPPYKLTSERWTEIVDVIQKGVYLSCVAFGSKMAGLRRGSIVNIASIAGMRSLPLHAYAPAKAAVISMTECLAAEWGPAGVRVNCVSPGFTRTADFKEAIDAGRASAQPMEAVSALGRLVEPEEIAKAVAFLASSDAAAITGCNLPIDCGWLAANSWGAYGGLRNDVA